MSTPYIFQTDWFSSTKHEWLTNLSHLKDKPHIQGLEIGSFEGRSALWLLEHIFTHPTAHLTCIDTWQGSAEHRNTALNFSSVEKHFDHNIQLSGYQKKITKIKDNSHVALKTLTTLSFDFIYIDGSHKASDVLEDAVLSWRLLKPGGILIFDDYVWESQYSELESPKIAVDSFITCFRDTLSIVHMGSQVTIRKNG